MTRALYAYRIPLKHRFRGVTERTGAIVVEGDRAAEFSPFPEYGDEVAARWADATMEALDGWPEPLRARVPVNATVPAVEPEIAQEIVRRAACTTVKVKVAEGDDESRVAAVRDALGPNGRIRVDANGGWNVEEAALAIRALDRYNLEYVEQPVATVDELADLRRKVDVPIAADESIRSADDPLRVRDLRAADIVVLKVQPLGGVRRALEIAEETGLPAVVSSALETSIGMATGVALAAALPQLPFACGLATVNLMEGDLATDSLVPVDSHLEVRQPRLDLDALERWRDAESEDAWKQRFLRAGGRL